MGRAEEKGGFFCLTGSGKITTLRRTVELLKDELKIGVMEADIDSDVDARAVAEAGVKSIQFHTGGMCHLERGHDQAGGGDLGGLAAGAAKELAELTPLKKREEN